MRKSAKDRDLYINRISELPNKSFLLFGPRGVGKSTLIKAKLNTDYEINLLKSSDFIELSHNPSKIREWVSHLPKKSWVFIDEVQKIPALMDEVHYLYEEHNLNFALSGSSARKMKRGGANLLAGRALQNFLYPLVLKEYGKLANLQEVVDWGCLPSIITDKDHKKETLITYVDTYLKQELIEEGLIRKLDPFLRFLKIAGQYSGQVLNIENISRESKVSRTTVDKYFEILEDTLIAHRLPAIQLGIMAKETTHPKLHFFDAGAARACAGLVYEDIDNVWRGYSFETYMLHEARAYNHYFKKNKDFFHYRVSGGTEIDFLIELSKKSLSKPQQLLAIEFKYTKNWDSRWTKQLTDTKNKSKNIAKTIGVYIGDRILTQGNVTVYPYKDFLTRLYDGFFW